MTKSMSCLRSFLARAGEDGGRVGLGHGEGYEDVGGAGED